MKRYPWVRDVALVVAVAVLTAFLGTGKGVTGLGWPDVRAIVDAAVASVAATVLLWLTPLTRRYGVGSASGGPVEDRTVG